MAAGGPLTLVAVALLAFLLAGVAQSVTGFGSSLVAAPLLALVAGAGTTVVAVTLVSLALTGWAGVRERAHVEVAPALRMSLAGLLGLPLGLVLLARAGDRLLEGVMATVVLVALVLVAVDVRLPASRWTSWGTGAVAGALLTSTGMNGPPLVLGASALGLDPHRFRGTLQVVLCTQDLAAVLGFVLIGHIGGASVLAAAVGVVVAPVGWLLGDLVFHRIPTEVFRRVLVAGLAVSAVMLLVTHR